MELKDQVALVTGASRGIGAATAKALAAEGARVAVNYFKNKEAADAVVNAITADGGQAIAVGADVRNRDKVNRMVDETVNALGPVDILVLNAGMDVPLKSFSDLTPEEFETKVFGEVQCFFYPAKAVVGSMVERKKGCIIGISSGLSRTAAPNFSSHTTAKSAVDGLMKSLAYELGPFGIRVNTVAPGLVLTDATAGTPKERAAQIAAMTPLRRLGEPEDIAGAVVMLATSHARFITGNYISASGGGLML